MSICVGNVFDNAGGKKKSVMVDEEMRGNKRFFFYGEGNLWD